MTRHSWISIIGLVVLVLLLVASYESRAQTAPSVQTELINAYQAVRAAGDSGGNVTTLASMLNQAAALNDRANSIAAANPAEAQVLYSQAQALISRVLSEAPTIGSHAAIVKRNSEIIYIGEMATLGVLAILACLYVPKLFWDNWTRNHRKWRAKKGITDVHTLSAALLIIFIIALGLTYNYFWANAVVQPYSEIALLGPNQTLSSYPQNVTVGQNFTLYLHIGDHEGKVMLYKVLVEIGNVSSVVNRTTTLNAPPLTSYEFVLANNQTALRQIVLNLANPGTNVKLVFELFVYSPSQQEFVYYNQWNQLVLNISSS